MGRQTREEHQEGHSHGGETVRHILFAARVPSYRRRLDGPGGRADAENLAVPRAHFHSRVTERTYARYSPSFMKDAAAALEF